MNESSSAAALAEFFSECEEIIQRVARNLQELEKNGYSEALIDALYRDVHTFKGSAQLFGFEKLGKLAHAMEASFGPARKLKTTVGPGLMDASFKCLDLIDRAVKALQSRQSERDFAPEMEVALPRLAEAAVQQFADDFRPLNDTLAAAPDARHETQGAAAATPAPRPAPVLELAARPVAANPEPVAPWPTTEASASTGAGVDTSIRVQVGLLDRVMNLVGELVLVRNRVLQKVDTYRDLEFLSLSQSLDVVTTDLQSEIMKTRMQPIGNVLSKLQRMSRDLARELGKRIDLTLQGTETELDKTLLEAVKDPLTHIVRNSCDHGIETPEERKRAGKPENGHVLVRAFHEGGQVVVEVSDDGKGLDRERILAKAVEKGLLTAERAKQMPDKEVWSLVFLPGFSTAKQVSEVSGRGVGMDVVRTNIEKIGGNAEVTSHPGRGTTLRLRIPLTLAIVPALTVRSGAERFAIPQIKLVQLVRVENTGDGDRVEYLSGRPMYRLRGELLPLVVLREILEPAAPRVRLTEAVNIVVLNAEGSCFGLVVDEILDTADIVVKPLSQFLKGLAIFSGATIMGDGACSLILDVTGIAEVASIENRGRRDEAFMDIGRHEKRIHSDAQEFLLFRTAMPAPHAIPLCLVHRLEEFPRDAVEFSGDQRVIRYRGSILPLLSIDRCLGYGAREGEAADLKADQLPTIVVQRSGRQFGLVVHEILDVLLVDGVIDDSVRDRPGVLGNLVHERNVIVVVDALGIIERANGRFRDGRGGAAGAPRDAIEEIRTLAKEQSQKEVRVLFAEDVPFFRKQVVRILEAAGHSVTAVEDGARALERLRGAAPDEFNLVLSDIEMPNLNGLQLAREVRKLAHGRELAMIALTTRYKDKDIQEGREAGFDLYLEKLNPDRLLDGIRGLMAGKVRKG
jgi:two-component system chemotaxis sensor kinase CheA